MIVPKSFVFPQKVSQIARCLKPQVALYSDATAKSKIVTIIVKIKNLYIKMMDELRRKEQFYSFYNNWTFFFACQEMYKTSQGVNILATYDNRQFTLT